MGQRAQRFVSKDWTELAARHLTDPEVCDISKARNQMKLLLHDLHTYLRLLWLTHNDSLHKADTKSKESVRTTTQAKIQHYYQHQHLIKFEDWYLFHNSLECLLSTSSSTRSRWLKLAHSSAKRRKNAKDNQPLITQLFRSL